MLHEIDKLVTLDRAPVLVARSDRRSAHGGDARRRTGRRRSVAVDPDSDGRAGRRPHHGRGCYLRLEGEGWLYSNHVQARSWPTVPTSERPLGGGAAPDHTGRASGGRVRPDPCNLDPSVLATLGGGPHSARRRATGTTPPRRACPHCARRWRATCGPRGDSPVDRRRSCCARERRRDSRSSGSRSVGQGARSPSRIPAIRRSAGCCGASVPRWYRSPSTVRSRCWPGCGACRRRRRRST